MTKSLDELDARILKELRANGRLTAVELASKLRQPRTTIVGRLKRLVRDATILGYTVRLNHARLGEGTTAFIMVAFAPAPDRDQRELARRLSRLPGIEEVNIVSGEWDILIKARGASTEAIGALVLDRIRREPGVARTLTLSSFATIGEPR